MGFLLAAVFILLLLILTIGAAGAQRDRLPSDGAVRFHAYQDDAYQYDPDDAKVIDSTAEEL